MCIEIHYSHKIIERNFLFSVEQLKRQACCYFMGSRTGVVQTVQQLK